MPRIKQIPLNNLIPIETELHRETLKHHHNLKKHSVPEIFQINGLTYIADGHHRIFNSFLENISVITAKYFSPENCRKDMSSYNYAKEMILEKRKKAEQNGIHHIRDLKLI